MKKKELTEKEKQRQAKQGLLDFYLKKGETAEVVEKKAIFGVLKKGVGGLVSNASHSHAMYACMLQKGTPYREREDPWAAEDGKDQKITVVY